MQGYGWDVHGQTLKLSGHWMTWHRLKKRAFCFMCCIAVYLINFLLKETFWFNVNSFTSWHNSPDIHRCTFVLLKCGCNCNRDVSAYLMTIKCKLVTPIVMHQRHISISANIFVSYCNTFPTSEKNFTLHVLTVYNTLHCSHPISPHTFKTV